MVSLGGLACAWVADEDVAIDVAFVFHQFFMLQWNYEYALNGVFWTLGIELQFYLVAPFIVWMLEANHRILKAAAMYTACLAWVEVERKYFPAHGIDSRNLLGNLAHFQAGILAATLAGEIRKAPWTSKGWIVGLLIATAVGLLLLANRLYFLDFGRFLGWRGVLLVDLFSFILLIAHIRVEAMTVRAGSVMRMIAFSGVLFYGIYAWHGLLLKSRHFQDNFFLLFGCSVLLALVSYYMVERPLMAWKAGFRRQH